MERTFKGNLRPVHRGTTRRPDEKHTHSLARDACARREKGIPDTLVITFLCGRAQFIFTYKLFVVGLLWECKLKTLRSAALYIPSSD